MKKNKYLKPIIMGVSFLMGLTIISTTILVSCSSNQYVPTQPKNTIFEDKGNVSSVASLSILLPSEAKEKRIILMDYIFYNLILGTKDQLLINDIKIINANDDDESGKLIVEYNISNYWFDNNLLNESKMITVSLIGFAKKTIPTIFIKSLEKDVTSDTQLSELNINQLDINNSLLKNFLFVNEISGNKESLNVSNIIINNFSNGDSAAGTVSLSYEVNKYWSNKGIVENNNREFAIKLIGFKKVTLDDETILSEINKGGEHQGLTINQYLPIIQSLNLTNRYRLNSLNNSVIEKTLNLNPDFSNLIVEISSANQSDQALSLSISGTYKGVNIPANEIINVTGFYNSIDNYHDFSKFENTIYISEIEFNLDFYFKNLQTWSDIKTWNEDKWMSTYLSKLSILKFPESLNHISFSMLNYWEAKIFENIKFNNVGESINLQTWKNLSINVDYNNYQYDKNSKTWNKIFDSNNKTFNFKAANYLKFNAPSQQNAIDWIAANATIFDVAETSTYYSSYWYSLYQKDDFESINSLITIDETITMKYFDKQLVVILDSMTINDYNGEMHITFKLDYNDSTLKSTPISLSTMTFKKLSEFIDAHNIVSENAILVKTSNTTQTSLTRNIIKSIQNEFTNDELNSFIDGNDVNMTSAPILFANTNQFRLFNGYANIDNKLNDLNSSIIPQLFNKIISPTTIDLDKNLFIINRPSDNKSKFMINYISVNVEENTKAVLTKMDNTKFLYKVPFKYSLEIQSDSSQNIEIDSYYYAILLNSDLGLSKY